MELDEKSVKIERLYALHKNVMLYTAELGFCGIISWRKTLCKRLL